MGLIRAHFMKAGTCLSLSTDCHRTNFSSVPRRTALSSAPNRDAFPLISPTKVGFNLAKQTDSEISRCARIRRVLDSCWRRRRPPPACSIRAWKQGRDRKRSQRSDRTEVRCWALATLTPHTQHLHRKPACVLECRLQGVDATVSPTDRHQLFCHLHS